MDTQVADILQGALVGGRYRVRDRVARRGVVSVHTATDERLGRTVTLKVVHPAAPGDVAIADRFIDEARTIARLTHPGVVACYDQDTHNGLPYLVMEHMPGRTLREVLATRRRLRPDEALAITEQMLAAMAAAHRAGLVHNDIKPENVLVAESPSGGVDNLLDSVVKITDLGFAQALRNSGADRDAGLAAAVAYVAPELVAEGRSDARSDVYSTGIVLFEMLTGQVPYHGGTPEEVAWQHVDRHVPPPSSLVLGVPPAADMLVARATRRDPAARPTDAGALLAEVQLARESPTTPAMSTGASDSTVVMRGSLAGERPSWARLPDPAAARGWSGPERTGQQARASLTARQRRMALTAAGAVMALLVLVGAWWFGFGRWMPAPDLLAMSEEAAVAEAEQLGLLVQFGEPRHSEHVAEGHVLAQEPNRGGRVARGGTLTLILSLGSEIKHVPNVIGAEFEVAKRQLESVGLVVREGEPGHSDSVPAGRVLALEPSVGAGVRAGDEINVSLSLGPAPVQVPSLVGMHFNDASSELHRLSLQAEPVEVDSDRPANEVVGQDPAPGTGVEEGATIRLEISKGPPTVPVPDLHNERCDHAEQVLREAGFAVVVVGQGGDRVVLQIPSAGTGLPPGTEVTIFCQ